MNNENSKLTDAAKKIYVDFGSGKEAVEQLSRVIREDDDLTKEAIRVAAEDALWHTQRYFRRKVCQGVEQDKQKSLTYSSSFQDVITNACGKFLNFPMMDGSKLANADKKLVLSDAERYRINARGNYVKANFLIMVATKLKDNQKVSDVYTDDQLNKLYKKAVEEFSSN